MDPRFVITVPFYNVGKWIPHCIKSIAEQTYKNFTCILVDDISTDDSAEMAQELIKEDDRFVLIRNTTKRTAVGNIYQAIESSTPSREDIIVNVDGDDWLASNGVLEKLKKVYEENDVWMTYGSYIEFPSKIRGKFARQIPEAVIETNSYRAFEWISSHLRTYKFKLWNKVQKEDLMIEQLGKWVKGCGDLALMFPMLEMSGHRALYIRDILYVYNRSNPLNEDKIDHLSQRNEERLVRGKQRYQVLESLY